MVGRFAAPVVHDDGLAEQPRDEDGGKRREQEREVRCGKHVDDVRVLQPPQQQGPVRELRHDRPQPFEGHQVFERARGRRIHGHEPRVDVGIVRPRAQQPVGLDGLSAENSERRRDDSHLERPEFAVSHHVNRRPVTGLNSANGSPASDLVLAISADQHR